MLTRLYQARHVVNVRMLVQDLLSFFKDVYGLVMVENDDL